MSACPSRWISSPPLLPLLPASITPAPAWAKWGPPATTRGLTDYETWVLSFTMLLGRVQIFSIVILFCAGVLAEIGIGGAQPVAERSETRVATASRVADRWALAALLGGGVIGFSKILPWLIALAANTMPNPMIMPVRRRSRSFVA
jgi:hypothetical protein